MPSEYDYDVFISYSHADSAWVRGELLTRLEEAGLRVIIDYRDFAPGAPSVAEMERAVECSERTLLVLTPAYLASAWSRFERLMLQTLDAANEELRLIPLLREDCDLPTSISYLTYVNFADPDDEALAWRQLLTALGAPPPVEGDASATPVAWNLVHPYPMPPNFTGRVDERRTLSGWLDADAAHPLLVLRALGGFGKSALAWHWLTHDVDATRWPRVLWWSFYEGDNNFESFVRAALEYLDVDVRQLQGPRHQLDALLRELHQPGILLVLDGFERALRAYSSMMAAYQGDGADSDLTDGDNQRDCVSPLAEAFLCNVAVLPGVRGKVLMTTRLTPRVLEVHGNSLLQGCRQVELTALSPVDAVVFCRGQGLRGSRAEIETACARVGYHPLSLRLLAGLVLSDLRQPGDIAAARQLSIVGDLVQQRHHVLETAFDNVPDGRCKLLCRIACFRGPVAYDALHALAEGGKEDGFDEDVRDLIRRGLLFRQQSGASIEPTDSTVELVVRFDLHPIVRGYAYDRLGRDERQTAHGQLRDYFAAVPPVETVSTLDDLAPVIELYHHTVSAGHYDEARELFRDRIFQATYYRFGAYRLQIEMLRMLLPDGEDQPPRLSDERAKGWTLTALASSYGQSGQPRRAVPLFERHNDIYEKRDDKPNLAVGLANVAIQQVAIGALRAAEANLRRSIAICRESEDAYDKAVGHQELGRLLAYRSEWDEAQAELVESTAYWEQTSAWQGLSIDWVYRALSALLLARSDGAVSGSESVEMARAAACRALEMVDEDAHTRYPHERDYVRAHWLLGAAFRAAGDLEAADRHLIEALTRCRNINLVEVEADIIIGTARLRRDQGQVDEALRLAKEALTITERSGYVLQGADAHLLLAQLDLDDGERAAALGHARQARALATCDGPPGYTYKVAYDEAGALLTQLGVTPP